MSYSYDTKHDSPNFTANKDAKAVFGQNRVIKGITIHWWGDPKTNPSFEGVRDYLCRKNGNTSAHLVATGTKRQVACIVNFPDVAWHSGSATGNATTIGIECDPRCRPEDYDVVAELIADLRSVYGNLPLYQHKHWVATTCPGAYDLKKLEKIVATKVSGAKFGQVKNKPVPKPAEPAAPATPTPEPDKSATPPPATTPIVEKPDYSEASYNLLQKIWNLLVSIFKV